MSKSVRASRFNPDGTLIAVGSNDACVDIYTTQGLSRVSYCRGISSFVTHIDWSQDSKYLQVCLCVCVCVCGGGGGGGL